MCFDVSFTVTRSVLVLLPIDLQSHMFFIVFSKLLPFISRGYLFELINIFLLGMQNRPPVKARINFAAKSRGQNSGIREGMRPPGLLINRDPSDEQPPAYDTLNIVPVSQHTPENSSGHQSGGHVSALSPILELEPFQPPSPTPPPSSDEYSFFYDETAQHRLTNNRTVQPNRQSVQDVRRHPTAQLKNPVPPGHIIISESLPPEALQYVPPQVFEEPKPLYRMFLSDADPWLPHDNNKTTPRPLTPTLEPGYEPEPGFNPLPHLTSSYWQTRHLDRTIKHLFHGPGGYQQDWTQETEKSLDFYNECMLDHEIKKHDNKNCEQLEHQFLEQRKQLRQLYLPIRNKQVSTICL